MSIASDLTSSWKYFTKYGKKSQAKHLLLHCTHFLIHKVGKLNVFKIGEHFEIINSESLVLKFFDTENEAMNYCLDIYPETKIKKNMETFRLISMTDFVLETAKSKDLMETPLQKLNRLITYANFLKQPLTLGMFVPCDDDGNVLEEPQKENFTEENGFVNNAFFIETNVFQKAKSKVVFYQFRVIENDSKSHPKTVQFQNLVNAFWFLTETNSWHISKGLKKVEDLIPYNPDLAVSF